MLSTFPRRSCRSRGCRHSPPNRVAARFGAVERAEVVVRKVGAEVPLEAEGPDLSHPHRHLRLQPTPLLAWLLRGFPRLRLGVR